MLRSDIPGDRRCMKVGILGSDGSVEVMTPNAAKPKIVIASDGRVHLVCDVQIGCVYESANVFLLVHTILFVSDKSELRICRLYCQVLAQIRWKRMIGALRMWSFIGMTYSL